ncbi:MAG TPA: DNA polymerase III subunit alpha, partial [Chondromyces sp.]|nr:DNA polymerase III subunit alpha [Chondromyces sp.]
MFIHLQIQTGWSLLSSPISIEKLVLKAKDEGYKALAITDRNVMYGAVPFYHACRKNGIQPIIGLTADIESECWKGHSFPLVLLAKNLKGYQNLLKISSVIQTQKTNGLPVKWLRGYSDGLLAFTPGVEGEIEQLFLAGEDQQAKQAAELYCNLFGTDGFFFSLQNHGLKEEQLIREKLIETGKEMGISLIVSNHVQYLERQDAFAQQCLQAIRDGVKLSEMEVKENGEYYLKSKAEMADLFASYPEALKQTLKIAEQCLVELPFHEKLLPQYPLPEGQSADELLYKLCIDGLKEAGVAEKENYRERLTYELDVIKKMGFSHYFLIVWDFIKFSREKGILTGPGRGSAAGSLVAFALNITAVDPIKYNLLFERFLNPERVSMPDIDVDFPDHRRDEVIAYVAEKYGQLHTAQIITFGTLSAKAVMRDVARTFGFDAKALEGLSRMIPSTIGLTLQQAYEHSPQLRDWVQASPLNRRLFETALRLEGLPRHTSTHAAGVVISADPLVQWVPIQEGHNGIFLTQFPMDVLEEIGLLKIDFLGLRNLTILERIIEAIRYATGKKLNINALPLGDEKTFRLLGEGKTNGIFQLESEGMRKVLMRLRPNHFEDIVAVNALYRPGPMDHIPLYIDRKHGVKPVEYPHPDLKEILQPTFGVLIYQEQIMQIASKMAGFSLGEADLLRRAVGKKKKDVLAKERAHFVQGALQKGYSEQTAHEIYDLIVQFANYGFNRSHAVAYSF